MLKSQENFVDHEVHKFDAEAHQWWDINGPFKTLHAINPARLQFICNHQALPDKRVLDIGCGGGILSESMQKAGARVTGIDMAPNLIQTAQLHALAENIDIEYKHTSAEAYAKLHPETFDIITCMECLEHVPCPLSIVQAAHTLLKPGGVAFFSTINRTFKAYAFAIIGAEYLLKLLPKGTHAFEKFIKPHELDTWLQTTNLRLKALAGLEYNPLMNKASLTADVNVNYLAYAIKE